MPTLLRKGPMDAQTLNCHVGSLVWRKTPGTLKRAMRYCMTVVNANTVL